MKAINPATNELIKDYPEHSLRDIMEILGSVDAEFGSWRKTDFSTRSGLMRAAAQVLRKNSEKYAHTMAVEMGKLLKEGRAEIEKCAGGCEYYAENAKRFLADEPVVTDAARSLVVFQPLGTILAVMPWNFPFWQVFRFAAPALMAGNTAVLKHASNVPGCALQIEEVFNQAGFPANAFRSLLIGSRLVEDLIKDERIEAVTLTGSEPAGRQVAALAGQELKKTVLELGGSDPFIVLADADLSACLPVSVKARMINAGQSCIAAKRFIVEKAILKDFEEAQTGLMASLRVGDPLDPASEVGPLARPDLLTELHEQVQQSINMGARLLTGGKPVERTGTFYQPTVLSDVKKGMKVYDEETFGPVAAIIPVRNVEEAIAVANDSPFGLGGSVWSQDLDRAEWVARQIESGAVFINGMTKSDPRLPFGGIKRSGYGRELSHYGIKEFVNIKTIWIA